MASALRRIEEHDFSNEGMPIQPWKKEQAAKMKTETKKRNRKKAAMTKKIEREEENVNVEGKKRKKGIVEGRNQVVVEDKQPLESKCHKIRIFPNPFQKEVIKSWMGTVRWTYNACNAAVRAGLCSYSTEELRARFLNNNVYGAPSKEKRLIKKKKVIAPLTDEERDSWEWMLGRTGHFPGPHCKWVLDTPRDIRDQAIQELSQAYKTGNKVHGQGNFEVKFKSPKKLAQQCITINARDWDRKKGIFSLLFRAGERLCGSEPLPKIMEREFKLARTKLGRYYLHVPIHVEVRRSENQAPPPNPLDDDVVREAVFIDPGVRTFVTTFDLQGRIHEFGSGSIKRLEKLCHHLDDLISRTYKKKPDDNQSFIHNKKKRWRMRRAADRMRRRIHNLVDEAHRKIALWLCENYRVIVWPVSGVSKMTAKWDELKQCKRKIGRKTVRNMLTWSWYRFQEWLKHKAREFPEVKVVLVSEAYTTKTCTDCGTQNDNVGSAEVFCCASTTCLNKGAPRDQQGARNVGIRFLTEWARQQQQYIDLT